jgi:16S rRNA (uracil1498-N3)-methyltransferase
VCDQETELGTDNLAVLSTWAARPGEILTMVDSASDCWRVRITSISDNPRGIPFDRLSRRVESNLFLDVYQSIPAKERFELVLQKLTELGTSRIVPMETSRSLTRSERDAGQEKSHRWPDVVRRAAKQCRRAMLPALYEPAVFREALLLAGDAELKLMLYEGEGLRSIAEVLGNLRPRRVALLVGPEGGFTGEEVHEARSAGVFPVSLGPRILRTETAAIAGAALLQGLLGDMG